MPRTLTIDKVQVNRLVLLKDTNGDIQIHAEYDLLSPTPIPVPTSTNQVFVGSPTTTRVIQTIQGEVGQRLSGARRAAALALFDAVTQDVQASELG